MFDSNEETIKSWKMVQNLSVDAVDGGKLVRKLLEEAKKCSVSYWVMVKQLENHSSS